MKAIQLFVLLLSVILTSEHACNANPKTLKVGERFSSPDGKYSLILVADANDNTIVSGLTITDNKTGEVFRESLSPPVYSVKWTSDSKTIALIDWVAGGSEAEIYHLNNSKWVQYSPEPDSGDFFSVVRETLRENAVELSYKVGKKGTGDLYVETFVFHPDTVTRSNKKLEKINLQTYRSLQLNAASDNSKE